jgi:hypothetical protein
MENIPSEIVLDILLYLNVKDFHKLCETSSKYHLFYTNEVYWKFASIRDLNINTKESNTTWLATYKLLSQRIDISCYFSAECWIPEENVINSYIEKYHDDYKQVIFNFIRNKFLDVNINETKYFIKDSAKIKVSPKYYISSTNDHSDISICLVINTQRCNIINIRKIDGRYLKYKTICDLRNHYQDLYRDKWDYTAKDIIQYLIGSGAFFVSKY